ncbi:MAG: hypothetical protein RLZZ112_334 [Verrucomicrobiota bacterium]
MEGGRWKAGGKRWLPVIAWTGVIYATIPMARMIQKWVSGNFGADAFSWTVYGVVAITFAMAWRWFSQQAIPGTARAKVVLVLLAAAFAHGTWFLRARPEEALHFVQYGLLSALAYRAFAEGGANRATYLNAFLLTAILGSVDEVIQWLVPKRFFDFRDIAINVIAGGLIQLGLVLGIAPQALKVKAPVTSVQTAWNLGVIWIVLLGFCLNNTLSVWRPVLFPGPHLFLFDEAMTEYGHKIRDPEIGTFYSRFTPEQLRQKDERRAPEAAQILAIGGDKKDYASFLVRYSPVTDPFMHELRVHLYRRDRYLEDALDPRNAQGSVRMFNVAYRENQILERWFGHSLRAAGKVWDEGRLDAAAARLQPEPYQSPVSQNLITKFSQPQALAGWAGVLVVALAARSYDLKRRRSST